MRNRTAQRRGWLALVCTLTLALELPAAEIADIRAAYLQQLSLLHRADATIQYRRVQPDGSPIEGVNPTAQGVYTMTSGGTAVLDWAFDGGRWMYHQHAHFADGRPTFGSFSSFDGEDSYGVKFKIPEGTIARVFTAQGPPKEGNRRVFLSIPEIYLGKIVRGSTHTIPELLERDEAAIVGQDSIGGHDCWQVVLGACASDGPTWHYLVSAWFDSAAGYLPRRIVLEHVHANGAPGVWQRVEPLAAHRIEFEVLEFREFMDPSLQRAIWFPMTAEMRMDIFIEQYQVQSLKLNDPIPQTRFRPTMPPGTPVIVNRGAPGQLAPAISGTSSTIDELAKRRFEEAQQLAYAPTHGDDLQEAKPPRRWTLYYLIVGTGLLVALCLRMRR